MEESAGDVLSLDAEQFLSNFTSLREECDRLKTENQSLHLRCQQLTQENSQCQVDKQALERHIQKENLRYKEDMWNLKLELQKSQEERLTWKEKYLDLCIKSSQALRKELLEGKIFPHHEKSKTKKKNSKKKIPNFGTTQHNKENSEPKRQSKARSVVEDSPQNTEESSHQINMISKEKDIVVENPVKNQSIISTENTDALSHNSINPINSSEESLTNTINTINNSEETLNRMNNINRSEESLTNTIHNMNRSEETLANAMNNINHSEDDLRNAMNSINEPGEPLTNTMNSINRPEASLCNTMNTINRTSEGTDLPINSTLPEETTPINSVSLVSTAPDLKFHPGDVTPNAVVSTNATELYSLPPGTFELSQGQSVSGATTFILQTTDATFCAQAVMDHDQRPNEFLNQNVKFDVKNDSTFQNNSGDVGDESASDDNNKEFNFRCTMCNYTYSDAKMLEKHVKAKHTIKTFCCKECGKIYSTKSSLAQHVHHYHRHPNKYQCDVCSKKFHRKDFLVKHVKTHSDVRDFKCKHCDKMFKTQASLSGHINGSHNDKRRYICDYCGMTTSWRISHLEHIKLHTGEPRKSMRRKKQQELKKGQQQTLADLQYVPPGAVVQFINAE